MADSRPYDSSTLVIDRPYVIFTTRFGFDMSSGAKLPVSLKGCLYYVNAEPTLEEISCTVGKQQVAVWLPCVLLRGFEEAGSAQQLIRVVYDPHFLPFPGNLASIEQLTQEAARRPNTYDPLFRQ